MRVAVTGASGYIGTRVVEALRAQGAGVVALSRHEDSDMFRCLLSGATGNLHELMEGVDHVIHLAGRLVDDHKAGVTAYYNANVRLTDDVLNAALDAGAVSFVHASSRLVYPSTLARAALESADTAPDTPYGISKRWAEDLVQYASTSHGISALSLRIGQVTGGDHPGLGVINAFIRQAKETQRINVNGRGGALREFVHVDDVAGALIAALEYRGPWQAVNVGGTRPVSISEIAEIVAAQSPNDVEVRHTEVENEDHSCYALSPERAQRTLRWAPQWSPDAMIAAAFER